MVTCVVLTFSNFHGIQSHVKDMKILCEESNKSQIENNETKLIMARARLHMTKNLLTNNRRIFVDEEFIILIFLRNSIFVKF